MRTIIAKSSNIKAIDYNEEEQTLIVEFINGSAYKYFEVPEDVPRSMTMAKSVGKFFITSIRNSYDFEKVG